MSYDVLVVSHHPAILESIRSCVLESIGKFAPDKICEAPSENEAIRTIDEVVANGGRVGVVLEDIGVRDKGRGCAELLRHIRAQHPEIPVIVTSILASTDPVYRARGLTVAEAVLQLGAYAYVPKDRPIQELIGWVRNALHTSGYMQGS